MVVVDELHGVAAAEDLLASAGDLQSFFDHLGLEVADDGAGDDAAEEDLEWLSNKDAFPTVDTMEPAFMGPRAKVVRRWRRRADEEPEQLPNKDASLEVETAEPEPAAKKVVRRRRRRRRRDEGLDWLPNKDALLEVETAERETAVLKMLIRQRRAGASIAPTAADPGQRRRRADEELKLIQNKDASFHEVDTADRETAVIKMLLQRQRAGNSIAPTAAEPEQLEWTQNKDAFQELETAKTQQGVKKVVRRRLRRRAKEEPDWLPCKKALPEVETAEPALTKMVLRRRRAGGSIVPTAAKPRLRRCSHCGRTKTPHWRAGPEGPRTLCNACGRRYRSERREVVPEYRPLSSGSATFRPAPELHSSMPRRIVEMCRSSATLVNVVVRSASPTDHHVCRSPPPRTREAVCEKSSKPFRGDVEASSESDHAVAELVEVAAGGGSEVEVELEWLSPVERGRVAGTGNDGAGAVDAGACEETGSCVEPLGSSDGG